MKTRSQEKFVKEYETRIRKYRDEYYRQIAKIGLTNNKLNNNDIFYYLIPFLIGALIIVLGRASITSIIFGTFLVIVVNFGVYLYKKLNHIEMNNYQKEIRKLGYHSISDYEEAIKEIITGENGIYQKELTSILKKYGLSEDKVDTAVDFQGNKHYIWYDDEDDELCIVNATLNVKPKLNCLKTGYIRYYRYDKISNHTILKTDLDEYIYRKDAIDIFDKLIKEKKFDGHKKIDVEEYIDDFELFMHRMKDNTTIDASNSKIVKESVQSNILVSLVFIILFTGLIQVFPKYVIAFEIAIILIELTLNKFMNEYLSIEVLSANNEDEYIEFINNNQECLEHFRELKLALGIPFEAEPVYSPEGACYLVWVANGYLHVFLNLVYFNVVYIVIKTKDVEYYKVEGNECLVKIPNKTLCFTKDAERIFAKILPNKDYEWMKGIINTDKK